MEIGKVQSGGIPFQTAVKSYTTNSAIQSERVKQQRQTELMSQEEKQFFSKMYPQQSGEIMTYSPKGMVSPAQLGTIIDVKK